MLLLDHMDHLFSGHSSTLKFYLDYSFNFSYLDIRKAVIIKLKNNKKTSEPQPIEENTMSTR